MANRSQSVDEFDVGARSQTICFALESAHRISFLPSPSTSTKLGDSLPIETESPITCFVQCPLLFLGFSYQWAGFPGNPTTIRSIQPSRLTSRLKLRNDSLYSFAGSNLFPGASS